MAGLNARAGALASKAVADAPNRAFPRMPSASDVAMPHALRATAANGEQEMLTLRKSNEIVDAILAKAREMDLRPLCVVVTDIGAKIKSAQREDGCSQARIEMALGKAVAALALGRSSALVRERREQRPEFVAQVQQFVGEQKMFMEGGGELIRDEAGNILGAVSVTGATQADDEELALHGIRSAGFRTDRDLAHLGSKVRTTDP